MIPIHSRLTGLGVGLLSLALMTTEIVLTRVFSVIVWYHFAFLAISVALFGTGAAAVMVHIRQRRLEPARTDELLAKSALVLAACVATVAFVLIDVFPNWFGAGMTALFTRLTFRLAAVFLLAAAPFFVGGIAISLAMTRYARYVHRLYFWDLLGAGSGCLLAVPLLAWLGGPVSLLASAALAAAAGVTFALSAQRFPEGAGPGPPAKAAPQRGSKRDAEAQALRETSERRRHRRLVSAAVAVMVAAPLLGVLSSWRGWLEIRVAKGVNLQRMPPEFNRWNSFSMVTVLPDIGFRGWGLSPRYEGGIPPQKTLVIDMSAMTPLIRFSGSLERVRYVSFDLSALVYRVQPRPGRVCIVGAGGGKDVLAALAAGARHVTGVEVNPLIVEDVVKDKYRGFTGDLYRRDDVSMHVGDGRSFLRRTKRRYDVVLLSMVDTSAATGAGAYALTENGLYTADAFRDYFARLKPGGILSVSTLTLPNLVAGARLASLARDALLSVGSHPQRSVVVAQAPWLHSGTAVLHDFLVKPDGFTPAEVATLGDAIRDLGFVAGYLPGRNAQPRDFEQGWIAEILTAEDPVALTQTLERWPVDVSPVNDDRPFFFYQNRLSDFVEALVTETEVRNLFGNGLVVLAKVVVISFVMVVLFLVAPLVFARQEVREGKGPPGWDLAYVACLGLGFMFIEIALIQRFVLYLGEPTYTLSVVLFVLLVFGGLGSRLFAWRVGDRPPRRALLAVFAAVIAYAAFLGTGIGLLSAATLSWAAPARALMAGVVIAPLGFFLGIPFPTGLRAVASRAGTRIPWLWSTNSATSVLGSVLATMTALHGGIPRVLLVGTSLYACAAVLWPRVCARPDVSDS